MHNRVNKELMAEDRKFEWLLGEGSIAEVVAMVKPHFYMNGEDPSGQKVGLIDEYQIWAFMVDPFNYYWWSTFNIEGDFALHVKKT